MELILDLNNPAIRKEIGGNVRRLRREKELSQQRLARLSGVNQYVVSRVESGACWLDLSLLFRLADGLGETVAALLPAWVARLLGVPLQAPDGSAGQSGATT